MLKKELTLKLWGNRSTKTESSGPSTNATSDDFKELVGEDLSGITFVRDYLQFQFNPPPILNAYTPVTVSCGSEKASFGESTFANLAIAQINKVVRSVELSPGEHLLLRFEDDSTIRISLRPSDYPGSEAVNLFRRKDQGIIVV
jgi:hypothetical protein